MPLPERDDLDVDWRFPSPLSKDVFLYGVRDTAKARLAVLSCLEYQAKQIPFRSLIIHEDFESSLTKKDQSRITNIADKQFTTLDDFRENAGKSIAGLNSEGTGDLIVSSHADIQIVLIKRERLVVLVVGVESSHR